MVVIGPNNLNSEILFLNLKCARNFKSAERNANGSDQLRFLTAVLKKLLLKKVNF